VQGAAVTAPARRMMGGVPIMMSVSFQLMKKR
jgi:hypothetical protein